MGEFSRHATETYCARHTEIYIWSPTDSLGITQIYNKNNYCSLKYWIIMTLWNTEISDLIFTVPNSVFFMPNDVSSRQYNLSKATTFRSRICGLSWQVVIKYRWLAWVEGCQSNLFFANEHSHLHFTSLEIQFLLWERSELLVSMLDFTQHQVNGIGHQRGKFPPHACDMSVPTSSHQPQHHVELHKQPILRL